MTCPNCGADIVDDAAAFCPRCGNPLGAPDAETTGRIEPEVAEGDTRKLPVESGTRRAAAGGLVQGKELVGDLAGGMHRTLEARGWIRALQAAAVGWVALLAVGAVLVLLTKLLNPEFGSGETPLWVFTRVVIGGLWAIGVAVERGGDGGAVLPVGTVVLVGWALVSAARRVTEASAAVSRRERLLEGLKVAVPFALLCLLSALIFRIRTGREVGADPLAALLVPLVWGALFGAFGGLQSGSSAGELTRALKTRADAVVAGAAEGIRAGLIMLVTTAALTLGAVLLFLVVALATARSVPLSAGDAIVFVVVLAMFLPNIVAGAAAFSFGAPIEFLARTIDGAEVERRASLILGGEGARGYAYLLLLVPAVACLVGGFAARRRTGDSSRMPAVLLVAASTYALISWSIVMLTGVRVSQAFIGSGNYLVVSAGHWQTLLLALLWALVFGYCGWRIAEEQQRR